MEKNISEYFSKIGRKGGRTSRRTLTSDTARRMVQVREARRAYKQFFTQCFWSCDPHYIVTAADVQWVRTQLLKNGDRSAYQVATKLCR